jgi:Ca2+-binding EF-hand superfamily protein
MEGMDLNHDGKVTWDEFVIAAIDKVSLLKERNIDAVFNLLDRNNDEMITMDEIKL